MHRIILLLSLLLCSIVLSTAAAESVAPDDKVVLRSMLDSFLAGAGRNDAQVHEAFWADDLIYTRSAGVRIGKAELMEGVRAAPAAATDAPSSVYTAEDVRIQLYADAAVVAFRLVSTTQADDKTEITNFLNTGTFIKRDGKWQAVAWQSTRVPSEASAK